MDKILLTFSEAARQAGVSRATLYRWAKIPGFPVLRIGGCSRIPVRAFEAWLMSMVGGDNE